DLRLALAEQVEIGPVQDDDDSAHALDPFAGRAKTKSRGRASSSSAVGVEVKVGGSAVSRFRCGSGARIYDRTHRGNKEEPMVSRLVPGGALAALAGAAMFIA